MSTTSSATAAVMAREKNVAAEPRETQKDLVTSQQVIYTNYVETSTNMPISEFKAKCLGVVDDIANTGAAITLTKRGQPVARVIPIESVTAPLKDTWAGAVRITGDLVTFDLAADWEAAGQ